MAKGVISPILRGGVVAAIMLALALGGCGRRGALDRPDAVDPAVKGGSYAVPDKAPEAATSDRPFILDAII